MMEDWPPLLLGICFLNTVAYVSCQSNSTTTSPGDTTVTANNGLWMVIGVVCGVVAILVIVIVGCVVLYFHKGKQVHPHSDTDTIYSESETYTRPTTASHIQFDTEEEAMSKPVSMTPFELRKLYVETFPYSNWRKSFDGHLRPHMGLRFVDPKLYARSKNDESSFRQQIRSFEMSDTLTLPRSNTVSRLTRPVITAMSNLETLQEVPSNSSDLQNSSNSRTGDYIPKTSENLTEVKRHVLDGDDVEL